MRKSVSSSHSSISRCKDFVLIMFEFLLNFKLYHWNTNRFSRHKASDEIFQSSLSLMDQFVEVCIGKYGRSTVQIDKQQIDLRTPTDEQALELLHALKHFLIDLAPHLSSKHDSDLLNIRDSLLSNVNQCIYLFTLH